MIESLSNAPEASRMRIELKGRIVASRTLE